ncbi:mismatch-specific DNA-glycosylase [Geosporobacter ferrireducens]|uniref:Mismatch-specific DNA-glycosylase n=1 Tax=Geosporobacter ferrireducens TaxID=1424294 RepID=A0A1D8GD38_9FIRM|nr:mismatch-specific DNA-glycosylase [Geosporobacter ferrireducens]AOT68824.1 mismatch-specific DNA-glycosylase [Geosporobacter ferrireducens]MTI56488.1 mismatch-specific DNA-glycosylase [Geosporobacter ferrireducens]
MDLEKQTNEKPLPDIIAENLDILFVGFNPGLQSAAQRHHYAGKSNRFWRFLYESGLTPVQLKPQEDRKLLDYRYGSTNIVDRETRNAEEIRDEEYDIGREHLKQLILKYKPKIVCYVGIGVYKKFSNRKDVVTGLQQNSVVGGVRDYVCSSTSGLNSKPMEEQITCFKELLKLLKEI